MKVGSIMVTRGIWAGVWVFFVFSLEFSAKFMLRNAVDTMDFRFHSMFEALLEFLLLANKTLV